MDLFPNRRTLLRIGLAAAVLDTRAPVALASLASATLSSCGAASHVFK
jgi:hypothetical protein